MTGALHTLLQRQIQRHLGLATAPAELESLLRAVDATYRAAERVRQRLEQSLELSSDELVQANNELETVLRSLPDGLLWIGAGDEIVKLQVDETILPTSEWLGLRVDQIPEETVALGLATTLASVRTTGEMDAVEFDLHDRCFEARLMPLPGNKVLAMLRDISARKQAEEALLRAKESAVAVARSKGDFLATMSHEIRTPLNAILGMASLLGYTDLDDEQREFLDTVRIASETLLALINDVLDLSKFEAGRMVLEEVPFFVEECATETVAILGAAAKVKRLRLSFEGSSGVAGRVRGDPTRLRQVLLNLVGNAVKFTEKGSITVSLRGVAPPEGTPSDRVCLRFEVSDTGIGIEPEAKKLLFQPFTQADASTSRRFGGSGLGLAISKRIVDSMGGAIGLESTPGKGTTLWFTMMLPLAQPGADGMPTPLLVAAPEAARGGRILVVEDNQANRLVAERMLARLGYEVSSVTGGGEALDALARQSFDLILMDCQMPVMDGYDTTRELRRRESDGQRTPVIAFTANVVGDDLVRCREAGMDDCIIKPVRMETLRDVLSRWLG